MLLDPELAVTVATVIEEGTLDSAARRLHLTPSAVSQRIKALEERLGQRLLVRSKPVQPTAAGLIVLRSARQFALVDHQAGQALGLEQAGLDPSVSIAVNADSLAGWIFEPLAAFARERGVVLDLRREDQERTVLMPESGLVMAAVTTQQSPVPGCLVTALGAMTFDAVASPSWMARWAAGGLTPEVLQRAPRVDYDRADSLQAAWLRDQGIDPHHGPRHFVPSTQMIAEAVHEGLGWAVLPTTQAQEGIAAGHFVALGGAPAATELFWQRWKESVPLLDELTDVVAAAARETLQTI